MMRQLKIPRLSSGGIITNYSCTSACGHCLYNCSPKRSKEYISEETCTRLFSLISNMGCRSVHIGGGEPFLKPEKLIMVIETAIGSGISIEYVETNASWFSDSQSARSLLTELKKAGLKSLLISISPFHNEFIPYAKTIRAINACRENGLSVIPWIAEFNKFLSLFDVSKPHSAEEFMKAFGDDFFVSILKKYWVHMGGRALSTYRSLLADMNVEEILESDRYGCETALRDTSHFHFDLYGNYIPGLCTGIAVDAGDLDSPLSCDDYPLVTTLAFSGIKGLLRFAEEEAGYSPQRELYINKCDLCNEIRSHLVRIRNGWFRELAPFEYYHPKEG